MEPWYKKSFGKHYLNLYQHRDIQEAQDQVDLLCDLIPLKPSHRILDMACGAGRHLAALRKKGYTKLMGIDLSSHLLSTAQNYFTENKTTNISLIQSDMRYLPFTNSFDAIISLFTSFGYFKEDKENLLVLKNSHSCLSTRGIMLLDYFNTSTVIKNIVKSEEFLKDGIEYKIKRFHDVKNKRIEKNTFILNDGHEETYNESVRLYKKQELIEMFKEAGFKKMVLFGDLKGSPFHSESNRLIIKAQK